MGQAKKPKRAGETAKKLEVHFLAGGSLVGKRGPLKGQVYGMEFILPYWEVLNLSDALIRFLMRGRRPKGADRNRSIAHLRFHRESKLITVKLVRLPEPGSAKAVEPKRGKKRAK